jgi:hypothetical protein
MIRAAAMSASPVTQAVLAPTRAASFGASRAEGIRAAAMGSMLSAESSPESPRMSCRYCRTIKMKPNMAKNCTKIDRLPAARARRAKTRGSSIGARRRSSKATKPARMTRPAARPASVRADVQPWPGASMIE